MTATTIIWRDHLAVHPAAEGFPPLDADELRKLAEDIDRNDLKADLVFWRPDDKAESVLLDGRNRLDALAMLDRLAVNQGQLCIKRADGSLRQVKSFRTITGGDPERHADSLNLWRRHLTPEKKRELIARWIKANPEKSNNAIAKESKVATDKTVAAVRRDLESTSEIPRLEKTVGADGKARKRPKKSKATKAERIRKARERQERRKRKNREAEQAEHRAWQAEVVAEQDEATQLAIDAIRLDRNFAQRLHAHIGDGMWLKDALRRGLGLEGEDGADWITPTPAPTPTQGNDFPDASAKATDKITAEPEQAASTTTSATSAAAATTIARRHHRDRRRRRPRHSRMSET